MPADKRDAFVREALVDPIGDRPVVVERGEDLEDVPQDRIDADDIQDGLLLAGERRVGQVFGRGAGAHRKRDIT